MNYEIRYEENSLSDFNKGLVYYESVSISLVQRFKMEFWDCIDRLKENPKAFQKRYLNIWMAKVKYFPFTIHFLVKKETVYVLRVLHEKREY